MENLKLKVYWFKGESERGDGKNLLVKKELRLGRQERAMT